MRNSIQDDSTEYQNSKIDEYQMTTDFSQISHNQQQLSQSPTKEVVPTDLSKVTIKQESKQAYSNMGGQ